MLKTLRRKTLADLRTKWKQFLAVWLVLTLSTAFYGAFYPSGLGLVDSIYNTYDLLNFMDYQVRLAPASQRALEQVQALPGLKTVEGRLVWEAGVQLDPQRDTLTALRLISVPDSGEATVNRSDIAAGGAIQNDDEILLLKRFADRHDIQPGEQVRVWINGQPHNLRVAGLVFNPEYLVAGRSREAPFPATSTFGVAWLRYHRLAGLTGMSGRINEILVRLPGPSRGGDPDPSGQARTALEAALASYDDVEIFNRIQTASGGVVDANVNGNLPVTIAFSLLFLLGGLAVSSVMLGRMVQSEGRRIGTMRALGVRRGELVLHYLSFGALVGLAGALSGSILGYFNSFLVMLPFITNIAGGYLPGFINRPQWTFILVGFVVAWLGATLSGAYPAWAESNTPPGVALRPPTPRTPPAISRLPLGLLPLALRQALRNLLRVPGRSLGTALGVMAGSMMVFSSLAILDTTRQSFETYYASGAYDLRVVTSVLQPARILQHDLERIHGVQAVQPALYGQIVVHKPGYPAFNTLALAVDERQPFVELAGMQGTAPFSSGNGVWVGHNLARVLDLQAGDEISIETMDETRRARVLGVVSQVLGSPVFVPRSLVVEWMPGQVYLANAALLRVEAGQIENVRQELADLPGVVASEDYAVFVRDLRDYVGYFEQTAQIFLLFGLLLTLVVIWNTVSANLNEQRNELAILRSLGLRSREIALGVVVELLIVATIGVGLGIPTGRALGFYLSLAYNTDFYGLVTLLRPENIWLGAAGILLTVLLAALPGLRAVQKTDLGQVSKSQSL